MRISSLIPYTQVLAPALATGLLLAAVGEAGAQSRYETPPRAVLSGDLASPWILQLWNKPARDGSSTYTARPHSFRDAAVSAERKWRKPAKAYQRNTTRQVVREASVQPSKKKSSKRELDPRFLPQVVQYNEGHAPGTLVISTSQRYLYLVMEGGQARRYGVGVGREGFTWSGKNKISRKAEWPDWRPPAEMIAREREKGRELPEFMPGGPENPLGARALYIGSTMYRIHGTNQPWTIGKAMSSGCIRMRNEDVIDLYDRIGVGTRVVVL